MSSLKKRSVTNRDHKISKDGQEFIVEKIVSSRIRHKKLEYLLKWQGLDETENSWEQAQNLNCQKLVKLFEENRGRENANRTNRLRRRNSMIIETKEDLEVKKVEESKLEETDKENSNGVKKDFNKSLKNEEIKIKSPSKKIKNEVKEISQKKNEVINEISATESSAQVTNNEKDKQNSPPNETEAESLDNLKSYEIINDKYLVTDFLTRDSVQTGFEKGLEVEHILGATNIKGCLYLVLKFHGDDEPQLIVAEIVNKKIPQMVIKFYEKNLSWDSEGEKEDK